MTYIFTKSHTNYPRKFRLPHTPKDRISPRRMKSFPDGDILSVLQISLFFLQITNPSTSSVGAWQGRKANKEKLRQRRPPGATKMKYSYTWTRICLRNIEKGQGGSGGRVLFCVSNFFSQRNIKFFFVQIEWSIDIKW